MTDQKSAPAAASPVSTNPPRPSRRSLLVRAGVGFGVVLTSAVGSALLMHASIDPLQDPVTGIEARNQLLAGVASWGMQLEGLDVARAARSSLDLIVIDELAGGVRTEQLARTVTALQAKPEDGGRRLVLAHVAIGGPRDDGAGLRTRFWEEDWQAAIIGGPASALDRALSAGFDGVYLDHGDAHLQWSGSRPSAPDDLIALVERISQHGRTWKPGFVVVLQNPGALIESPRLRAALDAVAASGLVFGGKAQVLPNPATEVATRVSQLKRARRDGLPVLVVEHATAPQQVAEARRFIDDHGFLPYIAPRELDRLVPQD